MIFKTVFKTAFKTVHAQIGMFGFMTCVCVALAPAGFSWGQSTGKSLGTSLDTASISFEEYFEDKALRVELYQCGDARELTTTIHSLAEERIWPESPKNLITPFAYGKYSVKVFDPVTDRLIYSKGFDTFFAEYATTQPAQLGTKKTFETTIRIPMPKQPVKLNIDHRLGDNSLVTVFTETIDPKGTRIRREATGETDKIMEYQTTGHPHERVDLVFLSEGYVAAEQDKFQADVKRMTDYLFSVEPYQSAKNRFNVSGVFRPSEESGTDEPRQGVFRNTVLNASFNTLDIDRYLLLEDNHRMHQMAARVPYDTIVVLVNTTRYGGGSICLDFCVGSTGHPSSPAVFVHELGHGLSYLADEYIGNVSYNDMYPEGIEPVEPNITRELNPEKIKWKAFLTKDVQLPTLSSNPSSNERVVGAFEGGGYVAKGMYRAEKKCSMGSSDAKGFCVACNRGIERMIDYYAPKP